MVSLPTLGLEFLLQQAPSHALAFALGIALALAGVKMLKWYRRRRLKPLVEAAYCFLRMVCEPSTLNPAHPGNREYQASESRDRANALTGGLRRAGFTPPTKCTRDQESLDEWFRFLGSVRIDLG